MSGKKTGLLNVLKRIAEAQNVELSDLTWFLGHAAASSVIAGGVSTFHCHEPAWNILVLRWSLQ